MRDKCQCVTRGGEGYAVDPAAAGGAEFRAEGVERETRTPDSGVGPFVYVFDECTEHVCLLALIQSPLTTWATERGDREGALESEPPAARRTLLGCQSRLKIVDRIGFLRCFDTHQSPSSSKLHTAIALALDPQANLFSVGDHLTNVAARFNLNNTSVGFQVPSFCASHTYAFL